MRTVAVAFALLAAPPAHADSGWAVSLGLVGKGIGELAALARRELDRVRVGAVEAGFTAMFNGKDLTGWDGKPGWWTVVDGVLTSESTPEKPCTAAHYLVWTGGQPGDFEMLADFRLSAAANSGIQIRSERRPDWDTFGYQADMTGDGSLVGFIYHHSRGLIAGRGDQAAFDGSGKATVERIGDPAELLKRFRPGDWNTYRIVCVGDRITLSVNGVVMCRITDPQAKQAAAKGIIALQMHPGPPMKVEFRNLRIRQLR